MPGVDHALIGEHQTARGVLFASHFAEARELTRAK
jgi:hypothetical protein